MGTVNNANQKEKIMETAEFQVISFTLGRLTKVQKIKRQCGTFAAAKMLKARGYSLEQSLALLNR